MERVLFKDRVALVTGGNKGIGKAICMHLAEHECRVACGYGHDRKAAEAYEKEFRERGYEGNIYQCDVTEPDQIVAYLTQTYVKTPADRTSGQAAVTTVESAGANTGAPGEDSGRRHRRGR